MIFKNLFKFIIGFTIIFCIILRINASDTAEQSSITPPVLQSSLSDQLLTKKSKAQKEAQAAYDAYVRAEDSSNTSELKNTEEKYDEKTETWKDNNTQNTPRLNTQDAIGEAVNRLREKELREEAAKQEMMNDEINPAIQ